MASSLQSPPHQSSSLSPDEQTSLLRPLQLPSRGVLIGVAIFLVVVAMSIYGADISLAKLLKGVPKFFGFLKSLWPPDQSYITKMLWPLHQPFSDQFRSPVLITLWIAVLGTCLSIILAFPVGLLAARNTSPHPVVYQSVRFLLNVLRSVNSLVWAIAIVAAIGFGALAGVLALAAAGIGTLGKLYAEAIEAISPRPLEALRATGSGPLPVFTFAVLPQALPLLVSYTLLDFEGNLRSATILGIVGAGGIGFELQASFNLFRFHQVFTILLEIIVVVTLLDRLSAYVRGKLV
jgi:phosphonate transport system permease protein